MKRYNQITKIVITVTSLLFSAQLFAVEFEYTVFSVLRHSDNLAQNNAQLSGNAFNLGGSFNFENDNQEYWSINFAGELSREWFSIDSLDEQDRKRALASIEYDSPSSNFEFLLRGDYSQAPRDRFAVEDVGNLVDVNIATARPSYFFNITPLDLINLEITYLESSREGQDVDIIGQESFDFVNISKEVRYEKIINSTSELSLVFDNVITRFNQDSAGTDFDQDNLFLRWVGRGKFNQIQVEVGKSRVTDNVGEDFDLKLFNILYSRQINSANSIGINLRNSVNFIVSESFIENSINVDDQVGNFGNAQEVESANITYTMTGDLFSSDIQMSHANYQNLNGTSREKRLGAGLTVTYSLSQYFSTAPQTNIRFVFQKNKNTFENESGVDIDNDVVLYTAQFNYFASESLSYYVQWLKRDASSTSLTSAFLSGDANGLSVGFVFSPANNR